MRKILRGFRCAAVLAAALMGVVSARAEWIEYLDANGATGRANCTIVTGNTTALGNGWYAVKGEISCGSIKVTGTVGVGVHLILCDGAKLTVNGGDKAGIVLHGDENSLTIYGQSAGTGTLVANGGTHSAGIGLSGNEWVKWGGHLTINGGIIFANGNGTAAGIGGANYVNRGAHRYYGGGCTVTINGGRVTASGGDSGGSCPAAGIGGAWYGEGHVVAIHGGTVIAAGGVGSGISQLDDRKYGWDIGWGKYIVEGQDEAKFLSLTIDGGSVHATTPDGYAKGYNGETVYCVTVDCRDLQGPLKLSGNAYGARDLYPDNMGKVYLWLLNGDYWFTLSDRTKGHFYHAKVNGQPVTAEAANYGFRVDGTDVGQCFGSGWTFDLNSKVLDLNEGRTYTLERSAGDAPQVNVNANGATVVLTGMNLAENNRPALVVKPGVNAMLLMKGASTLSATGVAPAMQLDGSLTVNLAENADRLLSKIEVVSGGDVSVAGSGKLTVNGGTFCAHATKEAIASSDENLVLGPNVVMKAGADASSLSYVTKHERRSYVLIAPALTVTVQDVPNVGIVNVLAGKEQALNPTKEGGSDYRVLQGEDVFVQYESTNEMYLVTGENPAKVTVSDNVTVGKDKLVVSAVQVLTDGSHYLESHGTEWINTGYKPNLTTRIEAEFNPLTKVNSYSVFFGAAGADDSKDGVLLRYFNDKRINGWFCNENYGAACSKSEFENTLVMAELKAGEMTLNEVKTPIPTTGWPYDGSIYLFCGNLNGKAWRHQAMRLYSFKVWEWNDEAGREELVRDLVPFKTEDGAICGLYDRREGEVKNRIYRNAATAGKAFELGRDPGFRYRDWDEESRTMRLRVCSDPIVVTADTAAFEDGKWYVVTNTVSRGTITVRGHAHLILCDGAKLTAAGGANEAGVAVSDGDSLTIYGQMLGTGELVAKAQEGWGGERGAGIGGATRNPGGTVTINGGRVTAVGGFNAAGIGGGCYAAGGKVTINGGYVTAQGHGAGAGIGNGWKGSLGETRINGGTVVATGGETWTVHPLGNSTVIDGGSVRAVNYNGDPAVTDGRGGQVYCVTVKCPGLSEEGGVLRIEGLGDYGGNDIRAIDDELYLWLPIGRHVFTVSSGKTTYSYFAVVNGRARSTTVSPLTAANLRVNGADIFDEMSGTGWSYDLLTQVLTLSGGTDYVITGVSTGDLVRIEVTADANVLFSNATIRVTSDAVITVKGDHTLHLSAGNGDDAAYLFGEGEGVNAIKGGTTVVESGSVGLWATDVVPVDGAFSINRENEIMCVGSNETELPYVDEYAATDSANRILLVAPRCRFTVPAVQYATVRVFVRNPEAELTGRTGAGGAKTYELMLGDTAYVRCELEAGHVWLGELGEQAFEITGDMQVARDRLPVVVADGLEADYRSAKVDPKTAAVSYETTNVTAMVFDSFADKPGVIGKSTYGFEEWYVVTGLVECASVCVATGTVNLILCPGASLTLWGDEGQPGLGVMPNACLNIYGCEEGVGTLVAYGGAFAAGIGGGGAAVLEDESPGADAGWITVNGGVVTAIGGDFGAGIGGGAFGAGAYLEVNGGSVFAYGGYDAEDVGGGSYGEDGVTVVNGGNVTANSVEEKPVNAAGTRLYRVYAVSEKFIPTNDVPLAVKGLGGFGTADVFANEDGAICFYLPNGHYEFTVDGWKCVAGVQDGTASAEVSEERGGESEENEGESEEGGGKSAEVLGIEVGQKVLVTVRSKVDWTYRLRRVTFEGGNVVVGDVVWFATADGDTLTLRDDEPPAGSGFYVVEESEF